MPILFPEAVSLLVRDGDRDLWPAPTLEGHDSQTSCHSAHAQSQVWLYLAYQIWMLKCLHLSLANLIGSGLNLWCLQIHSKPECRWTWPGLLISSAWQKGPLGTRLIKCILVFHFFTGINWFSDLSLVFSTFDCFYCSSSECLLLFHDFPWPTLQFQAWKMKL